MSSAVRAHVCVGGPRPAGGGELVAAVERLGDAAGDVVDVGGSTSTAAPPAASSVDVPAAGDDRGALGHRLEHRQPEPLAQARVAEDVGAGVQRAEVGVGHEAEEADVAAEAVAASPQPVGAGDDQRQRPSSCADRRDQAGAGSCAARPCRRTGRSARGRP